jgi:hypothetical protein
MVSLASAMGFTSVAVDLGVVLREWVEMCQVIEAEARIHVVLVAGDVGICLT